MFIIHRPKTTDFYLHFRYGLCLRELEPPEAIPYDPIKLQCDTHSEWVSQLSHFNLSNVKKYTWCQKKFLLVSCPVVPITTCKQREVILCGHFCLSLQNRTRMHSSRMRTCRSLTVCCSLLVRGICLVGGGSAWPGGAACRPPRGQNYRHV